MMEPESTLPSEPDTQLLPPMDTEQLRLLLHLVHRQRCSFSLWLRDGTYYPDCTLSKQHTLYEHGGARVRFTVSAVTPPWSERRWVAGKGWVEVILHYREMQIDGALVADAVIPGEVIEAEGLRALPRQSIVETGDSW